MYMYIYIYAQRYMIYVVCSITCARINYKLQEMAMAVEPAAEPEMEKVQQAELENLNAFISDEVP